MRAICSFVLFLPFSGLCYCLSVHCCARCPPHDPFSVRCAGCGYLRTSAVFELFVDVVVLSSCVVLTPILLVVAAFRRDAQDPLGDTDGDDRSTLSARDTQALESLIDGYVSDIDSFLRHRDDFYAPGYAYNIDRLREQLPLPPALLRQLQRFRSAAVGEQGSIKQLTGATAAVGDKNPGDQKPPTRGSARRTMSRAEYVRFLRAQSDVLAVSANQASVSLVRLTPYRGQKTVRGKFKCVNVGCRVDMVAWESDASTCDGAERCPRCSRWVYPYEQHVHGEGPS